MNNTFGFILLLLTITFQVHSPAFAEQAEECTANTENYNAEGLKKRQAVFKIGKTVKKVLPSRLDKYAFIDEAELKNNTQVIYWTGGCAHVGYSFTFKGKAIKAVHNGKTKLTRAQNFLKDLDLIKDEERSLLLNALAEAKKQKKLTGTSPGQFTLPCGDATCALTDRGNGEISIAYDFAL